MRISVDATDIRWHAGWAPLAAGAVYLSLAAVAAYMAQATHVSCTVCVFKLLTGLPCAACGGTRTVLAMLQGNVADALRLNPLLACASLIAIPWLAFTLIARRRVVIALSTPMRRAALGALVLAVLANWAYLIAVGR